MSDLKDRFEYDPALDGFPKPIDIFAMNEHTLPCFSEIEAAKFIGVEKYDPIKHLPVLITTWRYTMAQEMLKARKQIQA